MSQSSLSWQKVLLKVYRTLEAGEKGFATAANNMPDRGMKTLFKSYARQRAMYQSEIMAQLQQGGVALIPSSSIPGMIHRGRVAIFASMIIEDRHRERVILDEVLTGENYALHTYRSALSAEMPAQVHEMLVKQSDEITKVNEQLHLLRGKEGKRMIVSTFNNREDALAAVQSLKDSGYAEGAIQKMIIDPDIEIYESKGATQAETSLSGAFGGALWGCLVGILTGIGVVQTSLQALVGSSPFLAWLVTVLLMTAIGALVGAALGLVIGAGLSEEDLYAYHKNLRDGLVLLRIELEESFAAKAIQLIDHA